ncbi:MAG: c-type cytochrome biogenesis protein CcsB [Candidatus Eisenbacteria bacterium]|nr:c-type cytochrome biogenesis protein CcsB [Candidatus Eisenbacteria bacterium]
MAVRRTPRPRAGRRTARSSRLPRLRAGLPERAHQVRVLSSARHPAHLRRPRSAIGRHVRRVLGQDAEEGGRLSGPDTVFFWTAFILYLAGTVAASLYVGLRRPGIRRAAFALTALGFLSNTVALVVRTAASGHLPITNLFEYLTFFAWAIVAGFLLLWKREELRLLTVFAAPVAFAMLVVASLFPSSIEEQLIPALQSYWLTIHVTLAVLGEAAFAVAFVASVLYLVASRRESGDETSGGGRLGDPRRFDEVTYKAIGVGFPLFTIGALFAGAVWAQRAWGRPWSWDPKETSSLIVWLIYAIYLHARLVRGWRGRGAAVLSIVGFAMTFFTILGSRILGGLHSYG